MNFLPSSLKIVKAFGALAMMASLNAYAQSSSNLDWHHKDPELDSVAGVSTIKAYDFVKGKKAEKVIVAIIDSGIDIHHEDLQGKIWVNSNEIPGNGIDDDGNGYVDDIHGWNFLGNNDGTNVVEETLVITRVYNYLKNLSESDKKELGKKHIEHLEAGEKEYLEYLAKSHIRLKKLESDLEKYISSHDLVIKAFDKEDYTDKDLISWKNLEHNEKDLQDALISLIELRDKYPSKEKVEAYIKNYQNKLSYYLNPYFDTHKIKGDISWDMKDNSYGNADVVATDNRHGTHVAGIIGANRENELGVQGIAEHVELMCLRAVPDGDERDKDIALAIRYAVDHGAKIINMSFGKKYSLNTEAVNAAIDYAHQNDVLMVKSAGNNALDNDEVLYYPLVTHDMKESAHWLVVGATKPEMDEDLVATFSNYGKKNVDVMAPGYKINSTLPDGKYGKLSGTSMATPLVAGMAAMIKSYYPTLKMSEIKEILIKTSVAQNDYKVRVPRPERDDERDLSKLKKISKSGGIVNLYEALKEADKRSANL
ncbi:S8 family serine peptidase [Aureibacter tunicatorum]|uniref:Subtilisin family serine protease n=1 Tax=Aureibacter tunicatorum TaxID=866807 RepID=A0AAE3XS69_9BACT|nr:S8 family serine peptidase [Aureibacter tunicatorum]MDR6241642.1 subtilisin family serine protease [Aureibacter tunicatorum]BDD07371.1 peptidase S8 [Aureibacter tunicatorum]